MESWQNGPAWGQGKMGQQGAMAKCASKVSWQKWASIGSWQNGPVKYGKMGQYDVMAKWVSMGSWQNGPAWGHDKMGQ